MFDIDDTLTKTDTGATVQNVVAQDLGGFLARFTEQLNSGSSFKDGIRRAGIPCEKIALIDPSMPEIWRNLKAIGCLIWTLTNVETAHQEDLVRKLERVGLSCSATPTWQGALHNVAIGGHYHNKRR